ncbi:MAG: sialate O-acetylesterase [Bacteroidales bacterium]|jgi:sialate O-acetylesterase|nr:sialate O-acetylesterase [Bacteroidales bacterium]
MTLRVIGIAFLQLLLVNTRSEAQYLRLASIFGDHMVIQQGINSPVWGYDLPGNTITIEFAGYVTKAVTQDDGRWMARMPALKAGGPFRMTVHGSEMIVIEDVMVGEVWLASGQSNMEWTLASGIGPGTESEIASANLPSVRFFTVPKKTAIIPLTDTDKQIWRLCTPSAAGELSAVAYFFAKELSINKGVAVGVISSSWGATGAEAWIGSGMLSTHPDFREALLTRNIDTACWNGYVRESLQAEKDREEIAKTSFIGLREGVTRISYDDSGWMSCSYPPDMKTMGLGGYWGLVWLRKMFVIPRGMARLPLSLITDIQARGAIIYINGKEIYKTDNPSGQIDVKIPNGVIRNDSNVLSVRLYVNWGSAHLGTERMTTSIRAQDGKELPLDGEWKFNPGIEIPVAQWQDYYNKPSVLFNGRIAPVMPYGIRGVIWYQGENNAGNGHQYRSLFPLLINDWRIGWQQGNFPFLFVQLPNYLKRTEEPGESKWAELREAQMMTLRYPATGMAVTIDIGDPDDIHPKNKREVGRRLSLLARKLAYGEEIVASGPLYESMKVEGSVVRLRFASVGSGLISSDPSGLKGFTVAGTDGKFCIADALIDGDEVIVSSPRVPMPVAVRYAWADNPECSLINREGLPASPFRTDSTRETVNR